MHSFFLATIAIYLLYLNDAFEVHPSGLRGRPTPTFTAQQRKFQREMLQAHNAHRKRHCASPLRLDDRLSRSAQNYAQRLATIKTMVHSGTKGLGENLYFKSSSNQITEINGTQATQAWYDEIKLYNFKQAEFSAATGHFTQVVWKTTQRLGVGFALTDDKRSLFVVAQYASPGNIRSSFKSNILPENCSL